MTLTPEELAAIRERDARTESISRLLGHRQADEDRRALLSHIDALTEDLRVSEFDVRSCQEHSKRLVAERDAALAREAALKRWQEAAIKAWEDAGWIEDFKKRANLP